MTTLLIALLAVLVIPLFITALRVEILAVFLQGALLCGIALHANAELSVDNIITLVDLGLVRGALAPLVLLAGSRQAGARVNEVSPPSLVSWTLALGVVLLAFRFANRLVVEPGDEHMLIATTVSALLLGFLRLGTQAGARIQMAAVLRIENAVALFEIGNELHDVPRHDDAVIHASLAAMTLVTILFFRWYLATLDDDTATPGAPAL